MVIDYQRLISAVAQIWWVLGRLKVFLCHFQGHRVTVAKYGGFYIVAENGAVQIIPIFHSIIIKQSSQLNLMDAKLTNTRKREIQTLQLDFSYRKISYELRRQLIELVIHQGASVYRASKILKINNSTAKAIIRKYRKDGTIYMRKGEIENLIGQEPLRNPTEFQEPAQEPSEMQECRQEVAQEQQQAPFFYIYTMGLQTCYGFPTYSFTNFY